MTEDQLEQETLGWLADVGYSHAYGPDIAHDGPKPERAHSGQVILTFRLREAMRRLKLRLMVKRILRKYKYPPDLQDAAVDLVLQQAQVMGESWAL